MLASGHHGYPEPEESFGYRRVYEDACPRCGIHGRQVHPFRIKQSGLAPRSAFLQLRWVFDAFFVHRNVADTILRSGLTGLEFGPVLNHRTGAEIDERVQLLIPAVVNCAETSQLFAITCRPDNEELVKLRTTFPQWRFEWNFPAETYCGRKKTLSPTTLGINRLTEDLSDLIQTEEWFGSGGLAFRATLASERFVALVRQQGWRGIVFHDAKEGSFSEQRDRLEQQP